MTVRKIALDRSVVDNGWANVRISSSAWIMKIGFDTTGLWVWLADNDSITVDGVNNWQKIEIIKDIGKVDDMSCYSNSFMKDGILYHAFNTFIVAPTDV